MSIALDQVIKQLGQPLSIVIVDGDRKLPNYKGKQEAVVGADNKYECVAAASIVAKHNRDDQIIEYSKDPKYSIYKWDTNKGYGTREHRYLIALHGPCDIHRKSFKGVKEYIR